MSITATITDNQVTASFSGAVNIDVDTLALATTAGAGMVGAAAGGTVQDFIDTATPFLSLNVVADATTARTLSVSDKGKVLKFTSASSVTVTVPADLGDDFFCSLIQAGPGQVTVAADVGVTLRNADSQFATQAQYIRLTLLALAADDLLLEGRTA